MKNCKNLNIGIAICGSFCTHSKILSVIEKLVQKKYNIIPIVSECVATTDTRFGKAKDFLEALEKITKHKVVSTIVDAEPLGPNNAIDVLVIAPLTGNTLAKIANGVNDTAVTMACKSHIRNDKPVVLGISTNDAMGLNYKNIATLMSSKNFYFIPFAQDNVVGKPKSLIANWDKVEETILEAAKGMQIQPVLDKVNV